MTEGERERIKLRANYLNGLGLIFAAAGGIGPAILMIYRMETKWLIVGLMLLWAGLMASYELHSLAMKHLKKLDE
ncbi:MAG: hypothetical protein EOR96_09690 [Mesorhizobium sp.]|nr:MAG: hypothetical protein EOR96_09690 [Mesorhizobium sp.]